MFSWIFTFGEEPVNRHGRNEVSFLIHHNNYMVGNGQGKGIT